MTNVERSGFRDRAYSTWHRSLTQGAQRELKFLDIDWQEFCDICWKRLAIYELAYDSRENESKNANQTRRLGEDSGTPAYLVLYRTTQGTVTRVRARRLWPRGEDVFTIYTGDEWADRIFAMRRCHPMSRPKLTEQPVTLPPRECPSCHRMHPARTYCPSAVA